MMVILHVMVGAGIAHVASARLQNPTDGSVRRPTIPLIAGAAVVGLLSHGVLDGLKHGYLLSAGPDIMTGATLAVLWCLAARPPLRLLFAAAIAASLLPDIIDHGTTMLQWKLGIDVPVEGHRFFPWHWHDGSGSLTDRTLAIGRNRVVSLTNHIIVLVMVAAGIRTSPWAVGAPSTKPS
jgi:hypothetical protein